MMTTVFVVLQVLIAITLVIIILLQHGKGADIGSAFGGGANNAMFAPTDATNILTKITWGLVISFFVITVAISAYQKTSLDSELEVFKNSQPQESLEERDLIEDLPE